MSHQWYVPKIGRGIIDQNLELSFKFNTLRCVLVLSALLNDRIDRTVISLPAMFSRTIADLHTQTVEKRELK